MNLVRKVKGDCLTHSHNNTTHGPPTQQIRNFIKASLKKILVFTVHNYVCFKLLAPLVALVRAKRKDTNSVNKTK